MPTGPGKWRIAIHIFGLDLCPASISIRIVSSVPKAAAR